MVVSQYAHSRVTVLLLTNMPEGLPSHIDVSRTYFRRGWTTYEYCSAQLAKNEVQYAQWSLVMDLNNVKGEVKRILPTTPERFAELIATKDFTNDADCGAVGALYSTTMM